MAHEAPGNTLDAPTLVHEAYLRQVGPSDAARWDSRGHFFAAAAEAMRRILVDAARRKRIGLDDAQPAAPDPRHHLLALDAALTPMAAKDPPGGDTRRAAPLYRPFRRRGLTGPRHLAAHRGPHLGLRPGLAVSRTQRHGRRPGILQYLA
jgi:hypothetical protein